MKKLIVALIVAALAAATFGFAMAQDTERSRFVRFVERQISTPDRQIRLGTINGALSSDVRISSITIADREGVWLTINDARLVWSRLALIRGRLDIDLLEASSIEIARKPVPPESESKPLDDTPFEVPSLPVEVLLDKLSVPEVEIAAGVIGDAARLGVDGSIQLAGGTLDADLAIQRLDAPGSLNLKADFSNSTRNLSVNLTYNEPAGGVLADALDIDGEPELTFTVDGDGPLNDFTANIALAADGAQLVSGTAALREPDGGTRFTLDLAGNLARLVPAAYAPFVDDGSRITVDVTRRADGTVLISQGELSSGAAQLAFNGTLAADFVPTDLSIDGTLGRQDGAPLALPGGDGMSSIGSATIKGALDGTAGTFNLNVAVADLDTAAIQAPTARLTADGTVRDIASPTSRAVTFRVSGGADGLSSNDPAIADALGRSIDLAATGSWMAGRPVQVDGARITADDLAATFAGTVGQSILGTYQLKAGRLAAFSGLAGRDLAGSIDLSARGTLASGGLFDLNVDATADGLSLGSEALDGLLGGTTRITGSAARQENRITFQTFKVDGQTLTLSVDGSVSDTEADLFASLEIAALRPIDSRLDGAIAARASVTGNPQAPNVALRVTSDGIAIDQEELRRLTLSFDGTLDRTGDIPADLDGRLALDAVLNGAPASLSATLTTTAAARQLDNLALFIAGARAEGRLARHTDGLFDGRLALNIPDLAPLARLALVEASGTVSGTVSLTADNGDQHADIDATARQIEVPGAAIGFADIDLAVEHALGIPTLDGKVDASAVKVAGYDVRSARLNATGSGANTDLTVAADLGTGTLSADGRLTRTDAGFTVRLAAFELAKDGFDATLDSPTTVEVAGQTITIAPTDLSVGEGRASVAGTVGESVDLTASLQSVPLSIANLVQPDLGLGGRVSGDLRATGARNAPDATFSLNASGVTAALLRDRGIEPITITASGHAAKGTVTLDQLDTAIGGGTLTASGTVGETLDLVAKVTDLPLALANAAQPDLGLSGTLSGEADLSGTLTDPVADITAMVDNASAAMLRSAGLPTIAARLAARYAAGTADISEAVVTVGPGQISATGKVGDTLDLTATLSQVPLALANAMQPDLGVSGDLNGTVTAKGSLDAPNIAFQLDAPAVNANALRSAGLPTAALSARGTATRRGVELDPALVTIGGARIEARGLAGQRLNLTITANDAPLALANGVQPGLGLGGTLSATADVTGTAGRPNATFSVRVANLTAEPLRLAGLSGIDVRADGRFDGTRIVLTEASATGPGLSARASGTVPLSGGGLDLSVNATAPLALAERFVATRGTRLGGTVVADVRVAGSLAAPQVTGRVSSSDLAIRDPLTGFNMTGGVLSASLAGDRVVIDTLRGSSGNGTMSISGSIGITGAIPADLTITVRNLRLADGQLYAVTLSADLRVTGPLTAGPLIAGDVDIERAEIAVPTSLSGSPSLIAVEHFNIPPDVMETLRRARAGPFADQDGGGSGASAAVLDVTIDAPARIFIRGRGIDAELGGRVRLTGPVDNIVPVGGFELIRGRLSLLGQRIDFVSGSLTFFGDLNPTIRLVAETRTDSVTVRVIISGPANDPRIVIESDPELPQDEALAQLLFGRSISDLSAFQLAQLAASVAELAGGGGGPSIMDQVRLATGFDDIDIVTDDAGHTSVRAGRYIADNIYVGVIAGQESSGVSVNLDISRNFKVRAEALTDESTVGVYFEREY